LFDATSLHNGSRGKKKSSSQLGATKRFVLPPSYFQGKAVSPVERLDTGPVSTLTSIPKPDETETLASVQPVATVKDTTAKPTPEISKNQHAEEQETLEIKANSVASSKIETPVVGTSTISEAIIKPATRPAIDVARPERKISGLSLKSIQLKQKMQQELRSQQPDSQNLPTDPFKEETLIAAWKEYTALVQQAGKHILFSHLSMGEPRIEGELIHLIFPNTTIKLEVEREQGELLGFIKKKLNNYNIDLSIEVNEQVAKKYAYSTREKFEKLNEKNPLLDKLRQTFDLEL
jgi:DNA polymerase-3 subunit gamma/tau